MAVARQRANARVGQRLPGGGQRKPMRARGELEQPGVTERRFGRDLFDFGTDAYRESAGIELPDGPNPAAAGEQAGPGGRRVAPDGCHHADPGNGNPSARIHRPSPTVRVRPAVAMTSSAARVSKARLAWSGELLLELRFEPQGCPGRNEGAQLHIVDDSRHPAAPCGWWNLGRQLRPKLQVQVHEQAARKHGAAGKVIGEEGASEGTWKWRTCSRAAA